MVRAEDLMAATAAIRKALPREVYVELTHRPGNLILRAASLTLEVEAAVPARAEEFQPVLVDAAALASAAKLMSGDVSLNMSASGSQMILTDGTAETRIDNACYGRKEQQQRQYAFTWTDDSLMRVLSIVLRAASRDSVRPLYNAIAFSRLKDGGTRIAATDSYRIAIYHSPCAWPDEAPRLVPREAVAAALAVTKRAEGVVMDWESSQEGAVRFRHEGLSVTGQQLGGKWPDIDAVIPQYGNPSQWFVAGTDLMRVLKALKEAAKQSDDEIALEWQKKTAGTRKGTLTSAVPLPGEVVLANPDAVYLNYPFVLDVAKDAKELRWQWDSNTRPVRIEALYTGDIRVSWIVMPMRP